MSLLNTTKLELKTNESQFVLFPAAARLLTAVQNLLTVAQLVSRAGIVKFIHELRPSCSRGVPPVPYAHFCENAMNVIFDR